MIKLGILPHPGKPTAIQLAKEVIESLRDKPVKIWLDQETVQRIGYAQPELADIDLADLDVLLVLGGDGALLSAARLVSDYGVPILGVNVGHLGFLTELETPGVNGALEQLLAKSYTLEERMFIDAQVIRDGKEVARFRSLNDMVITRGTFARIIRLSTFVDDQHVVDYFADGLIVATPTGSTAYSLSAGGPIVEPLLACLIITPICPHTLAARSVVVRPEAIVLIEVEANHKDVMLTIDGQQGFSLQCFDKVRIVRADVTAKFVKLHGYDFFAVLQNRLKTPQAR